MSPPLRPGVALLATAVAATLAPTPGLADARLDDYARIVADLGTDVLPSDLIVLDAAGKIRVTVRTDGSAGAVAALEAAGAKITSCAGDVCAAWAAPGILDTLGDLGSTVRLELAEVSTPTLELSVAATGAVAVRNAFGLDGSGVAVGIVDTGCDWRHPDFRHPDGTTRILYLLDLTTSLEDSGYPDLDPAPIEPPAGTLYSASDIDRALFEDSSLVREADTFGHGTHVTGIAAGSGGPDGMFVGVAPGATIICVKADRNARFNSGDLIDAVSFVFDAAAAHGLPAVVNMSLGSQGGAHDGSNNSERAFTALVTEPVPGRSVVISAGNDGSRDIHAAGMAVPGSPMIIEFVTVEYAFNPSSVGKGISISGYMPGGADVDMIIETPGGATLGPIRRGEPARVFYEGDGRIAAAVCPDGPRSEGDCSFTMTVRDYIERGVGAGLWQVRLEGDTHGRVDAWFGSSISGPGGSSRLVGAIDSSNKVASPSTSHAALSIGSYVTRNAWIRYDGEEVTVGSPLGAISSFSGTGPGRGGALEVFKPDFAAPGEYIIAALSSDAPPTSPSSAFGSSLPPGNLVHSDGIHAALRGTSMSAPHVTGLVALLFQEDRWLTQDDVRALLRAGAIVDDHTGLELPDSRWGFGKVNVWNAVRIHRGELATTLAPDASRVGTTLDLVVPGSGQPVVVYAIPAGADGLPLGPGHGVSIASTAGVWATDVEDRGFGVYTRTLLAPDDIQALTGAVEARITATVDGVVLPASPRVFFTDARENIGRTPDVQGGTACSLTRAPAKTASSGGESGAALWAGLVCLVVGVQRGRRRRL